VVDLWPLSYEVGRSSRRRRLAVNPKSGIRLRNIPATWTDAAQAADVEPERHRVVEGSGDDRARPARRRNVRQRTGLTDAEFTGETTSAKRNAVVCCTNATVNDDASTSRQLDSTVLIDSI
jgi:hypothetical protein